jgi:hypothetical protein
MQRAELPFWRRWPGKNMVQEEMSSVDDRLGEGKGGREAAGV